MTTFIHLTVCPVLAEFDPALVGDKVQVALLCAILVCLALVARSLARLNRRVSELSGGAPRSHAKESAAPLVADAASSTQVTDPHTLAVIAAAVYSVLKRPARIVAVAHAEREKAQVWSLEGRRQVFQSHHVR